MTEWIVSSAALALAVMGLRAALRGRISPGVRYLLWLPVLLRVLLPVSLGASALSVGSLTRRAAASGAGRAIAELARTDLPRMSYRAAYGQVAGEYADRGVDLSGLGPEESREVDYEVLDRMRGDVSPGDILRWLWAAGAAAVGVTLAAANLRFGAALRRSRRRLDLPGFPLPVYVTGAAQTPCLFGLFRPAVYVTPEAAGDAAVLRHVTEHELTHFRHRDQVWAALRGVCLALQWFDPLIWRAAALSRSDCELACDESTVKRLGEDQRAAYGRTVINMTCRRRPRLLLTATTMTGSESGIRERVMFIAKKPKMRAPALAAAVLIAALAAGCAFAGAVEPEPDAPDAPETPEAAAPADTQTVPEEPEEPEDAGETMEFISGGLRLRVTNVRDVRTGYSNDGGGEYEHPVYILDPGSTLTVLDAGDDGKRWAVDTAAGPVDIAEGMESLELTPDVFGVYERGSSVFALTFERYIDDSELWAETLLESFAAGETAAIDPQEAGRELYIADFADPENCVMEFTDLDNDGEPELAVSGPYGGTYFDARDGGVYIFAAGEGEGMRLSHVLYDGAEWIVYTNSTNAGYSAVRLERYAGAQTLAATLELTLESPDPESEPTCTVDGREVGYDEYLELMQEIFGGT